MKKMAVLFVLTGLVCSAMAAELAGQEVAITTDVTYVTKYIWRGYDISDDKAAVQPSVNFDLGNGFAFNVWGNIPGSSKGNAGVSNVNTNEWDYTLSYSGSINEDCYKTDYTVGWRFYDYPDMASNDADLQEVFVEFAMPNLTDTPLVPHAAIYKMWPSEGSGLVHDYSGTIYVAGFSYGWTPEEMPQLPLTFSWDIVYNDGTGADAIDSDLSHMVWGLKTQMQCPMTGATVTPAVYYQNSFEDSVNTEDEFWAGISFSFDF